LRFRCIDDEHERLQAVPTRTAMSDIHKTAMRVEQWPADRPKPYNNNPRS
jgi:hypothetical protein